MTITLDKPTPTETILSPSTAAEPLTPAEQDTLLTTAAALDKPGKVPAGKTVGESRAWSTQGNVD